MTNNRALLNPVLGFFVEELETTEDILIPQNPLDRVIGQEHAVKMAKLAVKQRRHLLLVGYPGVGKSMIAQAMAFLLPEPKEEIWIVDNPKNPERPFVETWIGGEADRGKDIGEILQADKIPPEVAVKLGFKCKKCGTLSSSLKIRCEICGEEKVGYDDWKATSPFRDLFETEMFNSSKRRGKVNRIVPYIRKVNGKQEVTVYEQIDTDPLKASVRVLNQSALEELRELEKSRPSKVLVPLKRKTFLQATGASETELLGDVKHDPYGNHPDLGTPPYTRVVPGEIHEAHEGVLYIDELPQLGYLQTFLLTAMQDKKFGISGRNPQSSGSSVRVDSVPCDFIFVGACNIMDLRLILPPLRSRIQGNGYEVLLNSTMPDTPENRARIAQFVAQEVVADGRIPHVTREAVQELIKEAKRRAQIIDGKNDALTLRLRDLGGVIRMAGDLTLEGESPLIERTHMEQAIKLCLPVEEQIKKEFGSFERALEKELALSQQTMNKINYPENYQNQSLYG
ncbi:MAG: ATP-binding protein [Candidatus Jordarchaeum sp.]|uniref:ATP-binding protein n=1 Tax=Candidatus Jordarchaeum sp. TaxID=2823881 RepID=UPI00404A196F